MAYTPERADAVWLNFDPQAGHEQAGRRPAIVLSPKVYNQRSKLMICCPITRQVKGYPFEVPLPEGAGITGVVLADHIRSVDWEARKVEFIAKLPDTVLSDVLEKLDPLLNRLWRRD